MGINKAYRKLKGMLSTMMASLFRTAIKREVDAILYGLGTTSCDGISKLAKVYTPARISDSKIGDYTYIAMNSCISMAEIGKFCSIGPFFLCGYGIHPTNGLSTSPMFYSPLKQNGFSFCDIAKIEERKKIVIGNDVFIGANVTVLDGVTIGDGAIIGAGAVVSKDIPPYAIAVGCPIKVIRKRFSDEIVEKLLRIKWWDFPYEQLKDIEQMFFDVDDFILKYSKKTN